MRNRGLNQVLTAAVEIAKVENTKNQVELLEALNSYKQEQAEMVDSLRSEMLAVFTNFHQNQQEFIKEDHTGPQGDIGPQGQQGIQGPVGPMGPDGPQGQQGKRGQAFLFEHFTETQLDALKIKGDQGEIGPQGLRGLQGIQGIEGPKGQRGLRGYKGAQGSKGEQGLTGEQGIQGETGIQGSQGEIGPEGQQGRQGPIGLQGERGEKGDPFSFEDLREESINIIKELMVNEERGLDSVTKEELESFRKEFDKRISAMTSRIGILASSSGSGEVNLKYLDDVDTSALANETVLQYDSTAKKFIFKAQGNVVANAFQEASVVVDAGNVEDVVVEVDGETTTVQQPSDW